MTKIIRVEDCSRCDYSRVAYAVMAGIGESACDALEEIENMLNEYGEAI